jgi:trehalose 6-phosphate phosphatase
VLEVRPPVRIDKGAGLSAFLSEEAVDTALYAGDDRTDLDAFRALAELAQGGRLKRVIRVGVHSDEGPEEITSETDFVVEGTGGVRDLLSMLLEPGAEGPDVPRTDQNQP